MSWMRRGARDLGKDSFFHETLSARVVRGSGHFVLLHQVVALRTYRHSSHETLSARVDWGWGHFVLLHQVSCLVHLPTLFT